MLFLPRRGKITPANIRMKYRRRRLKAAQHHEALAAAEHLHDAAVDNDLSAPATPLPPAGEAEATPPPAAGPSPPAPRPPPNRALHFDTQAHLPAVEPSRAPEPSPPPVDDPLPPPDSTPGQGGSVLRMVEVQEKCTHGNSGVESLVLSWTDILRRRARPKTTGCQATLTPCARAATLHGQLQGPGPKAIRPVQVSFGSARTTATQKATHRSATSQLATTALDPGRRPPPSLLVLQQVRHSMGKAPEVSYNLLV